MGYDQPQIQGGLLGNSPYQRELDSGSRFAQARMQEDIRAAQEAADFAASNAAFVAKQEADLIKLNQLNNAVAPVVAPPVVRRNGGNGGNGGPKGNNNSGGSTYSGGGLAAASGYGGISGGGGK